MEQLEKQSLFQMPLGRSIYGDDCILTRKSNYDKELLKTLANIKQGRALFYETFVDENNENNNIK